MSVASTKLQEQDEFESMSVICTGSGKIFKMSVEHEICIIHAPKTTTAITIAVVVFFLTILIHTCVTQIPR